MNTTLKTLVLIAGITFAGFPVAAMAKLAPSVDSKNDSMMYLQELRKKTTNRLRQIDESLQRRMEERANLETLEEEMLDLKAQQREQLLRQEFLSRLIFQFDTKFLGGDIRTFLERSLKEMAKVDAVTSMASDTGLWKFLKFAHEAVHGLPEQKENILAFLEGYMNRSITNPVSPQEYLSTRNYTNGSHSDSGRPMSRDEAGTLADRRLQELSNENVSTEIQQQN